MRRLAVCGLLVAVAFLQQPGRVVADTKLDLAVDPLGFLRRALDLWEPDGFAGQLQNQAYGYLFPMGPFFALGDVAHLPDWVIQRLWWSLLLCTAFLGVRALAARLGIGTDASQLIAALAYALSPRILSTLGPVSAEAWPMALAPWVVLPLVAATQGAPIGRSALRSGMAVALTGGINAALSFAAVLPAALFLLTRRITADTVRLWLWWTGAVALATAWWIAPLFLLGAYSPPFLDFIESASTTTAPTSLVETLRGTSHWLAYLGSGLGSIWEAGDDLVRSPALVLDTVVVTALGLAGLAHARMRERAWLALTLLVGLVMVTFGHVGPLDGLFADSQRALLDHVLAPLRNVHKFEPLIRLPLVLGLAHLLAQVGWGRRAVERQLSSIAVAGLVLASVIGAASPALAGRLAPSGSFVEVPGYWRQAASWLERNADGRALLAPGSRFGTYYWGTTNDEPLQALTTAPWEVRNAIPLVQPGHIRLLDALEQRFAVGRASEGLAAFLSRAGISHVVVRNDLDYAQVDSARPAMVHRVLEDSPGFTRAATFGPVVNAPAVSDTVVDSHLQVGARAIEIWEVDPAWRLGVSLTPLAQVTRVSGGPESLLDLADAHLLPTTPTVLTGSRGSEAAAGPVVLTDGLRRREVDFGASLDNRSATLTADEPTRLGRPEPDYLPFEGIDHMTVGVWHGADNVTVSSSSSDAGALGGSDPSTQPASAFDGDLDTAWVAGPSDVDPWMRVALDDARRIPTAEVRLTEGSLASVRSVAVTVGGVRTVEEVNGPQVRLDLPEAAVHQVAIELVTTDPLLSEVGITEVRLSGTQISRGLLAPRDLYSGEQISAVAFAAAVGHSDGCLVRRWRQVCVDSLVRAGEEDAGIDRSFELPSPGRYRLRATAVPRPGPVLDRLLDRIEAPAVRARASSVAVEAPGSSARAAVDGRLGTGWTAASDDEQPSLLLAWEEPRVVSRVRLTVDAQLPATRPSIVDVTVDGETYRRRLDAEGDVTVPRARTDRVVLGFPEQPHAASYDPTTRESRWLPFGVNEVELFPEPLAVTPTVDEVDLPCGTGPEIAVDGRLVSTSGTASIDALVELSDVDFRPCGTPDAAVDLEDGEHRLRMPTTLLWRPQSVNLSSSPSQPTQRAEVLVDRSTWGDSRRLVEVPSRPEASLLVVPENDNEGWVARMGGAELDRAQVDGWMQGFVLPTGAAGTVDLRFEPSTPYQSVLAVGGLLLLALMVLAAVGPRGVATVVPAARPPSWVMSLLVVLTGLLLAGWIGATIAVVVVSIGTALSRTSGRTIATAQRVWVAATASAFVLAGGLLAVRVATGVDGYAGDTGVSQILSLLAIAAAVAPVRDPAQGAEADASDAPPL
jgi:arabinofuranan 3-O-arabinosyltransferase